ncbi:MAG: hypothetical protein Sapg2KO_17840 [Saprospiraceae bacterium]
MQAQPGTVDSLHEQLLRSESREEKIKIYIKLSKLVQGDKDTIAYDVYKNLAEHYTVKHIYDSVFYYYQKGLKLNIQDNSKLVDLHSILATAYYYQGDYEKSIETSLKAQKSIDTTHLNISLAKVNNNLGIVYIQLKKWEKAKIYMSKSLDICQKLANTRGVSYALGNLGIIYKNLKENEKAIEVYQQSIQLGEERRDYSTIARNYNNIGTLFEADGNYQDALASYKKGLDFAIKANTHSTIALSYSNIASALNKLGAFDEAKANYDKGLELSLELGNKNIISKSYLGKSEVYENTQQFKKALEYRKKYEEWNDSLIGIQHLEAISQLEIKYETERKEKEIATLSEQKIKNETRIFAQQQQVKGLVFSIFTVLFLATLLFFLAKQYNENKRQQELIDAISETQNAERRRIAQDLHDSIGGALALMKNKLALASSKENISKQDILETINTIVKTSDNIRHISHDLMPGELIKFGLVSGVQSLLDQINKEKLKTQLFVYNMEQRLDPAKEIQLYRITQEVIQNALKHAHAKSMTISFTKYTKHLNLMIEDDGKGFDLLQTSKPGLGLKNIKQRVTQLKGTFNIDTALSRGTTFNIQIPL